MLQKSLGLQVDIWCHCNGLTLIAVGRKCSNYLKLKGYSLELETRDLEINIWLFSFNNHWEDPQVSVFSIKLGLSVGFLVLFKSDGVKTVMNIVGSFIQICELFRVGPGSRFWHGVCFHQACSLCFKTRKDDYDSLQLSPARNMEVIKNKINCSWFGKSWSLRVWGMDAQENKFNRSMDNKSQRRLIFLNWLFSCFRYKLVLEKVDLDFKKWLLASDICSFQLLVSALRNGDTVGSWIIILLTKWRLRGEDFKKISKNYFGGNLKICSRYFLELQMFGNKVAMRGQEVKLNMQINFNDLNISVHLMDFALWNGDAVDFWSIILLTKWSLCCENLKKDSENFFGQNLKICNWYSWAVEIGDSEIEWWCLRLSIRGLFWASKLIWGVLLEGLKLHRYYLELQKPEIIIQVGFIGLVEIYDIQPLSFGKYNCLFEGYKLSVVNRYMQSIGSRISFKFSAPGSAQEWSGIFCSDQYTVALATSDLDIDMWLLGFQNHWEAQVLKS